MPFERKPFPKQIATIDDLDELARLPDRCIDANGNIADTSKGKPAKEMKDLKTPQYYKELLKEGDRPRLANTKYKPAHAAEFHAKVEEAMLKLRLEEVPQEEPVAAEVVAATAEISEADRAVIDALVAPDRPRREKKRRFAEEEVKPEVVEPRLEVRKVLKIDFDVDRGVTSYFVLRVSNHKKTITAKTLVKSESGRAAIVAFHKKHRAVMTMPADVAALLAKKQ